MSTADIAINVADGCPSSWRCPAPDGSDLTLDQFPTFRLVIVSTHLHRTVTSAFLRPYGLKLPEWRILATVASRTTVPTAHVCATSNMDKALISRTVASLDAAGLLNRGPDPDHGKRQLLHITPTGRKLFERIFPAAQQAQADLLALLTPDERTALYSALDKLRGVKPPPSTQTHRSPRKDSAC